MKLKKQSWFKRHPVWTGIIIVVVVLYLYDSLVEDCGEETFFIDSSIGCFSKCQIKCSDEGFDFDESEGFTSYFYHPNADYPDSELRRCECWCEGCE